MAPPPPPPPPLRALPHDLIYEILLLLPPDEPEHLLRASLVCKPWLGIIRDPGFRGRYREFHHAPPLLGFIHRLKLSQGTPPARFVSTTRMPEFPLPGADADSRLTRPLDCRHGRVLFLTWHREGRYLVWDPVTGHRHYLPPEQEEIGGFGYSAAVLCATDGCDHLDCHGGPFRVVFAASEVSTYDRRDIIVSVYSSETGAWSVPVCIYSSETCQTYARHLERADFIYRPHLEPRRGTLVGDAVYFTIRREHAIIKYDQVKDRVTMVDPPPLLSKMSEMKHIALMAMKDKTSLGFACIQGSSLYTWSKKVDTEEEEAAEWVQYKVFELEGKIPVANPDPDDDPCVVGFAEGVCFVFVNSGVGLFTINLSSGQVKKVDEPGQCFSVLPYMSFYLPAIGNGGGHDATDLPHNT